MKIAITGAKGMIGSALAESLKANHEIVLLKHAGHDFYTEDGPLSQINDLDVVIHLAGEPIAGIWTKKKKKKILESRVIGTQNLCKSILQLKKAPCLFICASAIGYYGDRQEEILTEESSKGIGFLSDVCAEWEQATFCISEAGIRTINLRLGIVLDEKRGALKQMLIPFRWGLGGVMGSGKQFVSWIALKDLITNSALSGPVNAVSPFPVTNQNLTKTLGKILKKPTWLKMPSFLINILFGEMGHALLLNSQRVRPEKLIQSGFVFDYPILEIALRDLLHD